MRSIGRDPVFVARGRGAAIMDAGRNTNLDNLS